MHPTKNSNINLLITPNYYKPDKKLEKHLFKWGLESI